MIDENDAPVGYKAVEDLGLCRGCHFLLGACPAYHACDPLTRSDGYNVIFIERETNHD